MSEPPARTSYELFVGHHLSPPTLATFPLALMPTEVPRNAVRRLRVGAGSDLAEIVGRLTECDVELLDIRRCPESPKRHPRQRASCTAPPEEDARSGVVVPLPVRPASGVGGTDVPGERGSESVSPISLGRRGDAGARRARRRRR